MGEKCDGSERLAAAPDRIRIAFRRYCDGSPSVRHQYIAMSLLEVASVTAV
jgi:hypothetical protein